MSDQDERREFNRELSFTLGKLTGAVEQMQSGLTAQLNDIKGSIASLQASQDKRMDGIESGLGERITHLERHLGDRISGLGVRVTALETEDKNLIRDTTRANVVSGGIAGALTASAVALMKSLF